MKARSNHSLQFNHRLHGAVYHPSTIFKTFKHLGLLAAFSPCLSPSVYALDRTWIGGNVDWVEGGSTANWTPADEPDSDDTAIFNTPNDVDLGSANTIQALTMSGGMILNLGGYSLDVNNLVSISGANTDLTLSDKYSILTAGSMALSGGGDMVMYGGGTMNLDEASGTGLITVGAGSSIWGEGTINLTDVLLGTSTLLVNNGGLYALDSISRGTLRINATDTTDARIDLDGTTETGIVGVQPDDTLDINVALSDAFSSDMDLYANSTLDMQSPWTLDGGSIFIHGNPGLSTITGGALTQTGGTISIMNATGSLRLDAPFIQNAGNFVNNGLTLFGANATIGVGANFTMPTSSSSITVDPSVTVSINQANFNSDGLGATTNILTIGNGGHLIMSLGALADEDIGAKVVLAGGELNVSTLDSDWSLQGIVQATSGFSEIAGEPVTFSGSPISVSDGATLTVNAESTFNLTSSASIGTGGELVVSKTTLAGPASISGTGTFRTGGTSTVSANTTIAANTFDWDGTGIGSMHTINDGVVFTINSPVLDSDGDGDMDDPVTIGSSGSSVVMNGPATWDMKGTLTTNTADLGEAIIGGTSRMVLATAAGILNANGNTTISAPVTFGTSSTTNVAGPAILTTSGDTLFAGGTITGAGRFDPDGINTVSGNTSIMVSNLEFDANMWTVQAGQTLTVSVTDYKPSSLTNAFYGRLDINSGAVNFNSSDATFVMDGIINFANTTGTVPMWSGEPLQIGNGGAGYAHLNVGGTGTSQVNTTVVLKSDAMVDVGAGATLYLSSASNTFDGPFQIAGAGTLTTSGTTTTANTTIATGTFDWDGVTIGQTHSVGDGVTLTITSPVFDSDGDMDEPVTLGSSGSSLIVSGPASWTMAGTLNANAPDVGTAIIGGTSRFVLSSATGILNANGNTSISAPVTFDTGSTVNVAAPATFTTSGNTIHSGGTITGAGQYEPIGTSTVTGNSTISVANFNFDRTSWTVQTGSWLTVNVTDYDPDVATNGFDTTITLNGGSVQFDSGDAAFVMNGTLNMAYTSATTPVWNGETLEIGNADATRAYLNATGSGQSRISSYVTFRSDADVNVGAGATLFLWNDATFNGPAEVSGAGKLVTDWGTSFTANTTIATGTFDWDGTATDKTHPIGNGVVLTITSPVFDDDGDMDDAITLGNSGSSLIVNGPASWQMKGTLTSNTGNVGNAVIGGTSEFILTSATGVLNADGYTTISAPVTFGTSSTTNVALGSRVTLLTNAATYSGATITGTGDFWPSSTTNTVTANTTLSTSLLTFDRGNWDIQPGTTLTVNTGDYDSDSATNAFDSVITLSSGNAEVFVTDPSFVMDGVLNISNTTGSAPYWHGANLHVGNDSGALDADINVGGTGDSRFYTPVTFLSDADVKIASGSTMQLRYGANFHPVNGASNASFTGTGSLEFLSGVFFNETTTLNMAGGSVDFDGPDFDGLPAAIQVNAPTTVNAATFGNFGKAGTTSPNRITINNNSGTGSLAVNLDNAAAEWTLNSTGELYLQNDNTEATLLSGSAINLNGTVNVTGDVRSDARLDIAGAVTIATAGEPFRLSGGDYSVNANRLAGGTINGPGILGADTGSHLFGYGTINANVDFDDNAILLADDGTLVVNGSILDALEVGTDDSDGILRVTTPWDSSTVEYVYLKGGELQGGALTINNANGLRGNGTVSAKVINNTSIRTSGVGKTLLVQTAANDNDWDGTTGTGYLLGLLGGTLDLRDNATTAFSGTVGSYEGSTVHANGFSLDLNPGSNLILQGGRFLSTHTIFIGGTTTVYSWSPQDAKIEAPQVDFEAGSAATIDDVLVLESSDARIYSGATFAGTGTLKVSAGRVLSPFNGANINVLIDNLGTVQVAGSGSTGRVDAKDYQQSGTASMNLDIGGTGLAQFDRIVIGGGAQIAGNLGLTLTGGFVPSVGQVFNILSASSGVTGTFQPIIQPVGMPADREFRVNYTATYVQLEVVSTSAFDTWIANFVSISNPYDRLKSANPDGDLLNNFGEFALDGNPIIGAADGKMVGKIAPVGGKNVMTLTFPVRLGAAPDPMDPAGGQYVLRQASDGLYLTIQASSDLDTFPLQVTEVTGPDAAAIQSGMPILSTGWEYRTFRSPGLVTDAASAFLRVVISE